MLKLNHNTFGLGHLVVVKVLSSLIESHLLSFSKIKLVLNHTWLPFFCIWCFHSTFGKNQTLTNWSSLCKAHFFDRIFHSCSSSSCFSLWRYSWSWRARTPRTILKDLTIPLLLDLSWQCQSIAGLHLMLRVDGGGLLVTFMEPLVLTVRHLIALKILSRRGRIGTNFV